MTAELEQEDDSVIQVYGEDAFYVKSDSKKDTHYIVEFKATCECPHFKYRGKPCKHIDRVVKKLKEW